MNIRTRRHHVLLKTCIIGLLCSSGALPADEPNRAQPKPVEIIVPVDKDAPAARVRVIRLNLNLTPEMLVFGSNIDAKQAADKLALSLADEIRDIDKFCSLSETQRKKLLLAGRHDIREFFARVEVLGQPQNEAIDVEQRRRVAAERTVLRASYLNGFFGPDSLFKKTLRGTLTDEQRGQYASLVRDRRVVEVETVLTQWDQRALDIRLTPESRRKLAELLFDKSNPPTAWSTHTYHVLLLQMAALENDLCPLFTEAEWPALKQELNEARELEPLLTKMGVWPVPASKFVDAVLDEREE